MKSYRNSDWKTNVRTIKVKSYYMRRAGATFLIAALLTLFLAACDSGGGSGSGSAALNEGVFVDSPVSGLNYQTETQAGITDENGFFRYREGENIRFAIGDVVLGEAPAEALMTPLHLVDEPIGEVGVEHPVVTNMARLLQSLDADANPENGIKIREDMIREVSGRMIDFHQSVHEFETDAHVMMLFDTLNGLNMPHNGDEPWHLRATKNVRQHMNEHMDDWMSGHMGGGASDGSSGDRNEESGDNGVPDSEDTMNPGDGMHDNGGRYGGGSDMQQNLMGMMNSGNTSTGDGWDDMHGGPGGVTGTTGGGHTMGH